MKILIWETLPIISGGQKMTLIVTDMLKHKSTTNEFVYLVPGNGPLTDELDKRNISYYIMGDQTLPAGIKSKIMVLRYALLSLKAIVKFLIISNKEKQDIIYTPGPAALPWGAICGMLVRKPVVWHLHHIFLDRATINLLNLFSGWKSVRKIISVSNCVADQIINKKSSTKKITIYNPVDICKYSGGNGKLILEELGIEKKENTLIIGHIALLQPLKQQNFTITVIEELKKRGIEAHACFIGSPRIEDAGYELQLKQTAVNKGLKHALHFMGQREDIPDILQAIDVLVIPSFEGFPLAGLEAVAAGKPVVAISSGGSGELIALSNAGFCFEDGNINEAVEMILKVIKTSNLMIIAENCKSFVKNYTFENYSEKILAAFDGVSKWFGY